jgi:hypothetical protein
MISFNASPNRSRIDREMPRLRRRLAGYPDQDDERGRGKAGGTRRIADCWCPLGRDFVVRSHSIPTEPTRVGMSPRG